MIQFLIDENLSPQLVRVAQDFGYAAYHVAHRGWSSLTDPQVLRRVLDENLTVVTTTGTTSGPCSRGRRRIPGSS